MLSPYVKRIACLITYSTISMCPTLQNAGWTETVEWQRKKLGVCAHNINLLNENLKNTKNTLY